eukprot:GSMAST32.ASY1.ANO1.1107.1 assembled CDS
MAEKCVKLGLFNRCIVMDSTHCVLDPITGHNGADKQKKQENQENIPKSKTATTVKEILQKTSNCSKTAKVKGFPPESFDRVLLDPPCSALGLRPRLECSYTTKIDLEGSEKFARNFMWCAVRLLKPGGTLVFSTCTISPMENEGAVRYLLDNYPLRLVDAVPRIGLPGLKNCGLTEEERYKVQRFEPCNKIVDALNDCDVPGFFCAKFIKTASMYKET